MKIIIGLGNPGDIYKYSRHNLGFLALDWLNKDALWKYNKKFDSLLLAHEDKLFVKPQTYMNNSGLATA
jgi:PTH1 family peptidyl-tRNA hydrolase